MYIDHIQLYHAQSCNIYCIYLHLNHLCYVTETENKTICYNEQHFIKKTANNTGYNNDSCSRYCTVVKR